MYKNQKRIYIDRSSSFFDRVSLRRVIALPTPTPDATIFNRLLSRVRLNIARVTVAYLSVLIVPSVTPRTSPSATNTDDYRFFRFLSFQSTLMSDFVLLWSDRRVPITLPRSRGMPSLRNYSVFSRPFRSRLALSRVLCVRLGSNNPTDTGVFVSYTEIIRSEPTRITDRTCPLRRYRELRG